jgi:GNAT superfamily N-acetyltransferase
MEPRTNTTRKAQALSLSDLFRSKDQIEFVVPSQIEDHLVFQVLCNGLPVAHARLEALSIPKPTDSRIIEIFSNRNRGTFTLKMIQVSPQFRKRGIGSMLLKEVLHWCRHNQVQRVVGDLAGETPIFRRWCAKNGFRTTATDQIDLML